ncbi:LEAF RUST 10 DISEASE-RESISTANCE LOCUS RECEPTOR-LIKE PROTEIN KINASE-like 2.2 [Prunus yedoensis var. nudiflora]|uniref:LEAF RUST 10 DISEASE-RESISTANCE LOCUS RECEPTOR-LIKE PROTEIN KINASE-like 2.2 n=1 Tax=Prunus yedoensis var. nudiflora TaxID=2094558 RepID=A0A314ZA51_PRUYE|nr:LEAF RUST 10 DISEASE-RESISTANCE LOCUS RECEPTOR-LIKE PROTEIN KINASE-like 2.2 [Prunus yedoensis var. nudiflora]
MNSVASVDFGGSPPPPEEIINSNKMVAAFVVSGVVLIVAVAAIIYAIINCVKNTGSTIPISARIVSSVDSTGKDSNQVAIDVRANQFPVKFDFPTTIKGFLSNMAREKPIAFSPKEIAEFTNNYNPAKLVGFRCFRSSI